jgi:outer membrane protein assembly factor BamB
MALKLRKKLAIRRTREKPLDAMAHCMPMNADPGHQVSLRELGTVLDEELLRLPEGCRAALVACHLEGQSTAEAAHNLGVPASTLKSRLQRGRELLRSRLERRGVGLSAMGLAVVLSASAASASVPASLVSSTIKAATVFAAGPAAAGVISVKVAALAEGAVNSMSLNKLASALVLVVVVIFAGTSYLLTIPAAEKGSALTTAVKTGNGITFQADAPDKGFKQAWSLEGAWTGVVSDDAKGALYTIGRGRCVELDLAGKKQREFNIPGENGSLVRLATWRGEVPKALLTFTLWSAELKAYDLTGKYLWSYPRFDGIDDIWAGDLNADGSDEVIVGYNGFTGLHVLDATGKLQWKSTAILNVWSVCAGDVLGEGKPQVVTTSAAGKVQLFDAGGKQGKELDAGCYVTVVRIGKVSGKDKAATILVAGNALDEGANPKTVMLARMDGDGAKKWSLKIPAGPLTLARVASAQLASEKPWLAVGMQGGQVHVVDIEKGEILATLKDQGTAPEVCWAHGKGAEAPLLLVATGGKLNAYRVAGNK